MSLDGYGYNRDPYATFNGEIDTAWVIVTRETATLDAAKVFLASEAVSIGLAEEGSSFDASRIVLDGITLLVAPTADGSLPTELEIAALIESGELRATWRFDILSDGSVPSPKVLE